MNEETKLKAENERLAQEVMILKNQQEQLIDNLASLDAKTEMEINKMRIEIEILKNNRKQL